MYINLNSRLNVKYDEDDDYLYVEINGAWVKTAIKAYAQSLAVFANGNFGIEVQNGIYSYSDSYTARPFTLENNVIIEDGIPVSYCDSIVSQNIIDFSVYGKINVKNSFQDIECDVSGNAYVGLFAYQLSNPNTSSKLRAFCFSNPSNADGTALGNGINDYIDVASNALTISEVIVE